MSNNKTPEIRKDFTVLPADDPKKPKLGWIFLEGEVILKDKKGFEKDADLEEVKIEDRKIKLYKNRLKKFKDIKNGDTVYSTWYDGKIVGMKVQNINKETKSALGKLNDSCYGNLSFNDDSRKCWRCGGYMLINTDAIARIEINTEEKRQKR